MKIREFVWFLLIGLLLAGLYYALCIQTGTQPLAPELSIQLGGQNFMVGGAIIPVFHLLIGFFLIYLLRAILTLFRRSPINNVLLIATGLLAAWFSYLIYLAHRFDLMGARVGLPKPLPTENGALALAADNISKGFPLDRLLYGTLAFLVILLFFTIYRTGSNDARARK